ncbi:MAG TPA: HAD family hydrolase, partial [Treponemataceae bacterium]|nr:HAD family hydrolase [Treponemataceae bacterium]
CDAVIGSEETGALKPSPVPFLALANALGIPPSRILYVGNSPSSDVAGAKAVGMKTACIVGPVSALFGRTVPGADISFSSYRQLTQIVLK